MNLVKIMVSEVLMFHENTDLFPSGDSYDIYPDDNDLTKRITLILVAVPTRNQPGWVMSAKEDLS